MAVFTVKAGQRVIVMREGRRVVVRGGRTVDLTPDEAKNLGGLGLLEAPEEKPKSTSSKAQ